MQISCPTTIIILSHVATPQNCPITGQQGSVLVLNSVCFVSDDYLQSVRNRTDGILHSGQRN